MTQFSQALQESMAVLASLNELEPALTRAADKCSTSLIGGGKLLICGNGGSSAEAAHFATELVGRFAGNRRSLPAVTLSSDGSLLTCLGNDYGFEHVFARQIAGLSRPGDLVVVLTSSGASANIVAALHEAGKLGLRSLAFLGRGGGRATGLATCELIIPGSHGPSAQEAHLFLIHHFCHLIEAEFK